MALALALLLMQGACGRDTGMTVSEYAQEVDRLIDVMNGRLDAVEAEAAAAPSLEMTKQYAREHAQTRIDFLNAIETLNPPADVRQLHDVALELVRKMAAAETALSDKVQTLETDIGIQSIWDTAEGMAANAVDQKVIALCLSAQSDFDRTRVREELGDVPWVPPEMKEAIMVTFGCTPQMR
jgi:hypothetical protein